MEEKKKIIIKRQKCIGCGSCVACSNNRINFIDGKAWAEDVDFDLQDAEDIKEVCPVDAIEIGNQKEYEDAKKEEDIKE